MHNIFKLLACFLLLLIVSDSKATIRKERFITQKNRERLVHLARDTIDAVRCRVVSTKSAVEKILRAVKKFDIQELDPESMKILVDMCSEVEIPYRLKELLPFGSRNIIFPGTKWCGSSNNANDYDDLGEFWETDTCCRVHDHCPDNIAVGQEKYGLVNKQLGTVSLCECDETFYKCLKGTNHPVSAKIGNVYFNILGIPCFEFNYPTVGCNRWGGFGNSQCQEYIFNETLPKIWEFIDAKVY